MGEAEVVQFKAPVKEPAQADGSGIIVLNFADSKVPIFKETRSKDYIKYGEDNLYPEYLNYLYNKSGKHNAILNGKASYIFGEGYVNGDIVVNRSGETLNDIAKKSILDIEIYGGYRWEVIWNYAKKIAEIFHVDYSTLRKGKDGGFYYKESWQPTCRDAEEFVPSFNPYNPVGSQIYEYNEYRPGVRYYPLPGYIGSNNYIQTDIEISKYYLSAITNGMMPSKMIQFFTGDPGEDAKKELERRWKAKFAGAENAGRFVMVYNNANAQSPVQVDDLSATELDKHFVELNKTTQQEIYAGHGITSPMLFGIKTEGQLGGSTELQTSYTIFQNTYSKPKAKAFDKEVNYIMKFTSFGTGFELQPSDPIGLTIDIKDVVGSLPKEFVYKKLGVPEEMWGKETVTPATGVPVVPGQQSAATNDAIKNLTGKQKQNIDRIVRQYENPNHPMTREQAVVMLKKGYNLDDDDIIAFLGEEPAPVQQMSFATHMDEIIAMFDGCGDSRKDYEVLKSKKAFAATDEDEALYVQEAFKTKYDVTATENRILELIKKDGKITSDVIATTIGETKAYVESKISALVKRGYIETTEEMIGTDLIIKRIVPDVDFKVPPIRTKVDPTKIFIKYSYEGPQDSRNRPFCAKLMSLDRLYSRAEIERISQRLGYSVFDRGGGFWTQPDGTVLAHCRHHWKSNIVIAKKGGDKS